MNDPRLKKLAEVLINHSIELKKGERILIQAQNDSSSPLTRELIREAYRVGALPFVKMDSLPLKRELLQEAGEEQLDLMAERDAEFMKKMDAFVGYTAIENAFDLSDVPADKNQLYMEHYHKKVHSEIRVPKTRWVVLRYPTPAMAQAAGMSREAFEDFFFDVCTVDYRELSKAMDPLVFLMERTEEVQIIGPGTDLRFSIKGIPVVKCAGERNIPDGEVFTAPVRDSVNGSLSYNTPAEYQGVRYDNIRFTFENGKIVEAVANDTERINSVLDTDAGARYVGEFALGVNPKIDRPMLNALFDEKIGGSFHFTPGNSYDDAPNGNSSAVHWDLVCIQTPQYGGGEICFDNRLIRRDGEFTLPELGDLNSP